MGFSAGGKVFSQDVASGATSASDAVNLFQSWDRVFLEIPTFASGGTHYVQGSDASDGTFRRIYVVDPADGADNVVQFAQATSQCLIQIPAGFQFYKVENTTGCTDTTTTYRYHVS
jgi:hypothetical protein